MIVVHHLENSRSQRILWLLEEMGLDYDIKHYPRDPDSMAAPEALKEIHPLGKSPVISDGDTVMAESGAIIEYLLETHGNGTLKPAVHESGRLDYLYWLHFAEGSLMPLLVMKLVVGQVPRQPMPFFVKPVARKISTGLTDGFVSPRLAEQLKMINEHLATHTWFAGEQLSGADIQMSFPLQAAAARADLSQLPNIPRFIDQLQARPAWQRALQRGGPLNLAGA